MIKEQLTKRVAQISEYTASYTRHVFTLDGKEVLHACKVYGYGDPAPYYSRINSCGEYKPQISKEEFKEELTRIKNL